jgi:hypothetical protein
MGGGLLQLSTTGIEDSYLNTNPNINLFKTVYMRYTNFSMNSISVPCSNFSLYNGNLQTFNKRLPLNEPSKFRVKIPRNGDLVDNIMLNLNMPAIKTDKQHGFQYISNLGTSIIKSASLYIEDTLIETITGEFLYNYFRLNNHKGKTDLFHKMINVNEDPFHIHNDNMLGSNNKLNKFYNTSPSIKGSGLSIPLSFWFSKMRGLALPLIALKFHQVYIDIELRPFRDLFLISTEQQVVHAPGNLSKTRFKFIKPPKDIDISSYLVDNYWELNPYLEINYIFLDNSERTMIVKNSQKYLIEQVSAFNINDIDGLKNFEFEIFHPIKEILIVPKRTDMSGFNEWTNFSNLDYNGIQYKDFQTFSESKVYTNSQFESLLDIWKYREYDKIPKIDLTNHKFYDRNIIESLNIQLDNNTRLEYKSRDYFTDFQKYEHYNGSYVPDILTYSFSKSPGKLQPSGSINMSAIDNIVFNMKLKEPSLYGETYKYNLTVYFVNYNILDIRNGMGGLIYGNR